MITVVYLVFMYEPKHKYGGFIYEGHYKTLPKVFKTISGAKLFCLNYKHATFIRKVKLYD